MTLRVAVIGNSHTIMMQQAWAKMTNAERAGCEVQFFAGLVGHFDDLQPKGQTLHPGTGELASYFQITSHTNGVIDPDNFDVFALVGLEVGLAFCLDLISVFHPSGMGLGPGKIARPIGQHLMRAVIRERIETSPAFKVMEKIRQISSKPIALIPEPFPSDRITQMKDWAHLPNIGSPAYATLETLFREGLDACCVKHDLGLWRQPAQTLSSPAFTKSEYLGGAVDFLGRSFKATDWGHMNADLGHMILQELLELDPAETTPPIEFRHRPTLPTQHPGFVH